ncbi:MAG: 6-carboxytetrahydropterin synthase, partial [Planctomycetota bacterium]
HLPLFQISSRNAPFDDSSWQGYDQGNLTQTRCPHYKYMPNYSVRIAGDNLIYSAAHFILLPGGICEPLHGHNFRVAVELSGPLDEVDCVIDFLALLQIMKSIVAELDHAVLLPTRHPVIQVLAGEDEVEVRFGPRRWVFPRAECRLLPVVSTTAERMANYLAQRLLEILAARGLARPPCVRIELEESPGCSVIFETPP